MPTQLIPVICSNPSCGKVFFSKSIFNISGGAVINSFGMRCGPCPECGSTGLVPDGQYTATSQTLFRPDQFDVVMNALRAIAVNSSTHDEAVAAIDSNFGFLAALKPLLPKDATQLTQYLQVLMVGLGLIVASGSRSPAPVIQLDKHTVEALHSVSAALERIQETKQPQPQQSIQQEAKEEASEKEEPTPPKK